MKAQHLNMCCVILQALLREDAQALLREKCRIDSILLDLLKSFLQTH